MSVSNMEKIKTLTETGKSLDTFKTQTTNAVNVLKSIKASLAAMKSNMQSQTDIFNSEDVQTVTDGQTWFNNQIGSI